MLRIFSRACGPQACYFIIKGSSVSCPVLRRTVINIFAAKQQGAGWGCGHPHPPKCTDFYSSLVFRMISWLSAGPRILNSESSYLTCAGRELLGVSWSEKWGWVSRRLIFFRIVFLYPHLQESQLTPSFWGFKELCSTKLLTSWYHPL